MSKRRKNGRTDAKQYCFNIGNDIENTNITVSAGAIEAVDMVFEALDLNGMLDSLKRGQGVRVGDAVKALVAYKMTVDGVSIKRFDEFLSDPRYRKVYCVDDCDPKSLYRVCDRLGENIDAIVEHIGFVLKDVFGVEYKTVFNDWTALFFEARTTKIIKFGHTKDHRPDRPQVSVGLSVDSESGMNCGLTVKAGNILDVTHFRDTFMQIEPFMDDGSMVVFDCGGYSAENGKLVVRMGHDFLTRPQTNGSDLKLFRDPDTQWEEVEEGLWCVKTEGNLGYFRYNFFSIKKYSDSFDHYMRRAEKDFDEMTEIRSSIEKGKKPPKKFRCSNSFIETDLSYADKKGWAGKTKKEALIWAVRRMITGREGKFTLMSSRDLTPSEAIETYRSRNWAETSFRTLKSYIDWRPARCWKDNAIRGRIMISYLVLTVISFLRFRCPDMDGTGHEIMPEKLRSFSVTAVFEKGAEKRRIYSNYNRVIQSIKDVFSSVMRPSAAEAAGPGP